MNYKKKERKNWTRFQFSGEEFSVYKTVGARLLSAHLSRFNVTVEFLVQIQDSDSFGKEQRIKSQIITNLHGH